MAHHCAISTESGSGSPALPFHPTLADRGLLGVAVGAALAPGPAIEATAPAKAQIATAELRECRLKDHRLRSRAPCRMRREDDACSSVDGTSFLH